MLENDLLAKMESINLERIDSVKLMNRCDTKYITTIDMLFPLLEKISNAGYRVLETGGGKCAVYRNQYFDTDCLQMYLDHHNKRAGRQKIRTRCYINTGSTFLEVKTKNNKCRTKKKRIPIDNADFYSPFSKEKANWTKTETKYAPEALLPSLEIDFSRITLIDPCFTERSTIDFDISFSNNRNGNSVKLNHLAIIEVKRARGTNGSLDTILRDSRILPHKISKYCIGTVLTDNSIKSNRFKQLVKLIKKTENERTDSTSNPHSR